MTKRPGDDGWLGADDSGELDLESLSGRHFKAPAEPQDAAEKNDGAGEKNDDAAEEPAAEGDWPKLDELPRPHSHAHNKEVHRRHVRQRAMRRLRVVLIVLLVIGVLVGGAAFAINRMIEEGGRSMREASRPEDIQTVEEAETVDDGLTVEYQGKTYRYNENVVSIVVMGYDRRQDVSVTGKAGQADAIMVVALDTSTGLMRVIGVPRDTMVDVDENVGDAFLGQDKMQIALAFSYGDGYESSAQNVVRAVSRVLYNMPMNYYLALNMEGVGPINDAVGGVTLSGIIDIAAQAPRTLLGDQLTAVAVLGDQLVSGGGVGNQQRAAHAKASRGWRGHPEIFADFHAEAECAAVKAQVLAHGHILVEQLDVRRRAVPRLEPAALVKFGVVGQVLLGHDAQNPASGDHSGAVVEPARHLQRQAYDQRRAHGQFQQRLERGKAAVKQCRLKQQVATGVTAQA